ncbi:MAG: hypothetical protein WAK11_02525 [Candidatus Cybelea sp.]
MQLRAAGILGCLPCNERDDFRVRRLARRGGFYDHVAPPGPRNWESGPDNAFDFQMKPRAFKVIAAKYSSAFFLRQLPSKLPLDTE